MLKHTGHALDAVVVLTVDEEELVQRLLQRAQTEGRADDTEDVIRRRQEVYAEQTAPLIEVYRDRGLLDRGRRHGRGRRGHERIFDALDDVQRDAEPRPRCSATAASRSRRPTRSPRCASPACVVGRDPRAAARRRSAPGVTTGELDAIAEDHIRSGGAHPVVPGLRHPPSRRTICASVNDEVVHGIPGDRVLARGRRDLDRLRRHRRRLARRRRDHGRRRRGARRGDSS